MLSKPLPSEWTSIKRLKMPTETAFPSVSRDPISSRALPTAPRERDVLHATPLDALTFGFQEVILPLSPCHLTAPLQILPLCLSPFLSSVTSPTLLVVLALPIALICLEHKHSGMGTTSAVVHVWFTDTLIPFSSCGPQFSPYKRRVWAKPLSATKRPIISSRNYEQRAFQTKIM